MPIKDPTLTSQPVDSSKEDESQEERSIPSDRVLSYLNHYHYVPEAVGEWASAYKS